MLISAFVVHVHVLCSGKETCEVLDSDAIVTTIVAHACKTSLDSQLVINLKEFAREKFNYDVPYSGKN